MKIQKNKSLKPLTTFKVGGKAKYFAKIEEVSELDRAIKFALKNKQKVFVLGGGSNVVISDKGFSGMVLNMATKGTTIAEQPNGKFLVKAAAGETWDKVVEQAVQHGLWGIENLSHIPGQAGAAVIQNIGAYGQEISSVLEEVAVYDITAGKIRIIKKLQCQFGYRKSIFNTSQKGKYVVLEITLKLDKNGKPNLSYKDLQAKFMHQPHPSLAEIRQAVIMIRDAKYPFPRAAKDGSAGSFFKNVYLRGKELRAFEEKFRKNFAPEILQTLRAKLRQTETGTKIPTAFLIEACGLKGYSNKGVKVNEKQPLVLLNKGNAKAKDVVDIAAHVIKTVQRKTGLKLEIEPELVGLKI